MRHTALIETAKTGVLNLEDLKQLRRVFFDFGDLPFEILKIFWMIWLEM